MNYINNFRFGEISEKSAGRFDAEYYSQGAFQFRNMKTGSVGGAMRRPPLRKLLDVTGSNILDIREFTISDSVSSTFGGSISFLVGLGETRVHLYRETAGGFAEIASQAFPLYAEQGKTAVPVIEKLTLETARQIRTCQYYKRLYFVHESFRPFYIDISDSFDNFTISAMTVILNQDAKKLYFTPMVVRNDADEELPGLGSRLVFKNPKDSIWYFHREYDNATGEYKYSEKYEYQTKYPPIKGDDTYIAGYSDAKSDVLLTGEGHYPSEIACINDCLYLAGTRDEPQVIWKSRVIGTSQYVKGDTPDSMHDFVAFQTVITEGKDLVSAENMPTTKMKDANGNFVYETDERGQLIYFGKDSDNNEIRLYWEPHSTDPKDKTKDFFTDIKCSVRYTGSVSPYNKHMKMYDLSDTNKLLVTVCRVDFVATDSCGDKIEMNTGRQDRVMFIRPSCGKIVIGTTSSEETLPGNFSPVSNRSREHYGDFGSRSDYNIAPVCMNSSLYFFQKTNSVREFYLYQGYMSNGDITLVNHDALAGNIASTNCKNTPDPMIYIVMEDGTMRTILADKDNGIMSISRWDSMYLIKSVAKVVLNGIEVMAALVEKDGKKFIAYFDEAEETNFADFDYNTGTASVDYVSLIETTYSEIIDSQILGFGSFKKANTAYVRCYNTGKIEVGDDERQLSRTAYKIGNDDYRIPLTGTAKRRYSVIIKAVGSDPMNILAFGYEVMKR